MCSLTNCKYVYGNAIKNGFHYGYPERTFFFCLLDVEFCNEFIVLVKAAFGITWKLLITRSDIKALDIMKLQYIIGYNDLWLSSHTAVTQRKTSYSVLQLNNTRSVHLTLKRYLPKPTFYSPHCVYKITH